MREIDILSWLARCAFVFAQTGKLYSSLPIYWILVFSFVYSFVCLFEKSILYHGWQILHLFLHKRVSYTHPSLFI